MGWPFDQPADGDPWHNVEVADWTAEGWEYFLRSLTPRQRIRHMFVWCQLGEDTPELKDELREACDQVRDILRWERIGAP